VKGVQILLVVVVKAARLCPASSRAGREVDRKEGAEGGEHTRNAIRHGTDVAGPASEVDAERSRTLF